MTLEDEVIELRPHHIELLFVSLVNWSDKRIVQKLRQHPHKYNEEFINDFLLIYGQIKRNHPLVISPTLDRVCRKCGQQKNPPEHCLFEPENYFAYIDHDFGIGTGPLYTPKHILEEGIRRITAKIASEGENGRKSWEAMPRRIRLEAYTEMYRIISRASQ